MSPGDVAPMVMSVVLIVVVGAVVLLRPISKRLGTYLEVLAEERRRDFASKPASAVDTARIANVLEAMEQRMSRIEERQEFTDRLLVERPPQQQLRQ